MSAPYSVPGMATTAEAGATAKTPGKAPSARSTWRSAKSPTAMGTGSARKACVSATKAGRGKAVIKVSQRHTCYSSKKDGGIITCVFWRLVH